MLSKSLWLVCLWFAYSIVVKGQEPQTNCTVDEDELPEAQSGLNNFVTDELGSIIFPYALNQCTAMNVITTGRWYLFECNMDSNGMSTVTKTEYFTDDCSGTGSVMAVYNESNMTEGEVGYFECGGSDTYARIRLSLDSDCENSVVVYAALGACTNMADNSQMNFFCSADQAVAQIFTSEQMQMTTTFFPSSTALLNATSLVNATAPSFNTTFGVNLTEPVFNATLATLFNQTSIPTQFNATQPTGFNATQPTGFNATMPSVLNISTSQIEVLMCEDDAFCDKWIITKECGLITTVSFGLDQGVYGVFEECSTGTGVANSTLAEFNTTFGENVTVTEPTVMITTMGNESPASAIRPSLLFTAGVFFSFFFLVSV